MLLLVACGGANPEPRAVVNAPDDKRPAPLSEPPPDTNRTTLEYVVVPVSWVEKVAPAAAADVKAWAEAPENKKLVPPAARTISLDDEDAAKKAIARIAKGEDFEKVRSSVEKPAATLCEGLDDDIRTATATLKTGEVVKAPVKKKCGGWLVVKKEPSKDDDLAAAYKKAKAPDLSKKLAEEILARMRTADSTRAAIAGAVESVLGDDAKENAERPHALFVVDKNVDALHMSPEAKEAMAKLAKAGRTGEVAASAFTSKNAFVAARVAQAPPR
jgi:hypothetical protein